MEKQTLSQTNKKVKEFVPSRPALQEKARSSREVIMEKGQNAFIEKFFDEHGKTEFTGYEKLNETGKVLHISEKIGRASCRERV